MERTYTGRPSQTQQAWFVLNLSSLCAMALGLSAKRCAANPVQPLKLGPTPAWGYARAGRLLDWSTMKQSVLIVEDDLLCRNRFAYAIALASDFELAGVADDLCGARALLERVCPDVLLIDLGLPDGNGVELIREVSRDHPHCDVMVATVFGDEEHVLASISAGATGYLLKESTPCDLVSQIRVLRAGGSPISPIIARQLITRLSPSSSDVDGQARLSPRELEVLRLCAKGYSFDEVADLMGLSRHTVTTFVKRIYRKLHVHSKTEAIFEAQKLGLMAYQGS